MKKKIGIIIIIAVLISLISGIIVYAYDKEIKIKSKLFTNEDKILIEDSYVENGLTKATYKNIPQLVQENLVKYKLDGNVNDYKIKYIKNNIDMREEMVIETEDNIMTLNSNTNEFISYVNKKEEFLKNEFSKEETKNIADCIFADLNICNVNDYKLVFFENFDEDIWMAGYAKKYGDLVNTGEQIRFSFAPQTREIVTLAVSNIEYDDNEVNVSEETAKKVAKEFLDKSTATDIINIYIDIVRPNELLDKNLKEGETYAKKQYMRKAYVCEFNNEDKTKIYIDCESGDFLGGSITLGGEF